MICNCELPVIVIDISGQGGKKDQWQQLRKGDNLFQIHFLLETVLIQPLFWGPLYEFYTFSSTFFTHHLKRNFLYPTERYFWMQIFSTEATPGNWMVGLVSTSPNSDNIFALLLQITGFDSSEKLRKGTRQHFMSFCAAAISFLQVSPRWTLSQGLFFFLNLSLYIW